MSGLIQTEKQTKMQAEYQQKLHSDFSDIFTVIGCFEGTFKLQVRQGSHQYQAPPRKVAYPLQEELDRLQKQ